ncbi:hypothetical protein ABVT39_021316 [Epinephelus coioides]
MEWLSTVHTGSRSGSWSVYYLPRKKKKKKKTTTTEKTKTKRRLRTIYTQMHPSILSDEASLGHTTLSPSEFGRPLCPKFKTTNESEAPEKPYGKYSSFPCLTKSSCNLAKIPSTPHSESSLFFAMAIKQFKSVARCKGNQTMDKLDEVTTATLKEANIGEDLLPTLSRDDIKDLFPGPENFLRRRALWLVVNRDEKEETPPSTTGGSDLSKEEPNISKFVTMSNPEYIVFIDSELEQARRSYFEQKRLGKECVEPLSKELFCRLIRNTMTNMISIARAIEDTRYPSKHEVNTMAKRLVEYYPMIKGRDAGSVDFFDSQNTQVRHYRTLKEMYKSKKLNKAAVTQVLDLEFEARRRFIHSDTLKTTKTKIQEAYPCFREVDHVLDELRRIVQPSNAQYISEMKERWESFSSKVQFYAVMKKAMKPPRTLNGGMVTVH